MRLLACSLFILSAALLFAMPAHAEDASLARVQAADLAAAALDQSGVAAVLAPRITLPAPKLVSFGFQGPAPRVAPHIVIAPDDAASPARFEGFGGYAARPLARIDEPQVLREVQAADRVEVEDVVEVEEILEPAPAQRVVKRYYTYRPRYVAHSSSYYVPSYRVYGSSCGWRSCCSPCWGGCGCGWGCGYGSCYRPCWRPAVYVGWGWGCGW